MLKFATAVVTIVTALAVAASAASGPNTDNTGKDESMKRANIFDHDRIARLIDNAYFFKGLKKSEKSDDESKARSLSKLHSRQSNDSVDDNDDIPINPDGEDPEESEGGSSLAKILRPLLLIAGLKTLVYVPAMIVAVAYLVFKAVLLSKVALMASVATLVYRYATSSSLMRMSNLLPNSPPPPPSIYGHYVNDATVNSGSTGDNWTYNNGYYQSRQMLYPNANANVAAAAAGSNDAAAAQRLVYKSYAPDYGKQ